LEVLELEPVLVPVLELVLVSEPVLEPELVSVPVQHKQLRGAKSPSPRQLKQQNLSFSLNPPNKY